MPYMRDAWLAMKGVMRLARQIINEKLEPMNLSGAEGDLLFLLLTGSNSLRQEELGAQLDVGKAAVSRAVDSLEKKGYVVRMRKKNDRRACSISLTDEALSVGDKIVEIYNMFYSSATKDITEGDMKQLIFLLSRVAANLRMLGET